MAAANQGAAAQLIGGPGGGSSALTPSWYQGAPLTKLVSVGTVVFYVLFNAKSAQDSIAMDSFRMLRTSSSTGSSQWHRYWSSKLTFGTTGELVMGGMLVTLLARQLEREMGSRKFGVFWGLLNGCAIAMEVVYVGASTLMTSPYRYQGPYAALGGMMYLFHRYSPRLHPRFFGILGFTFSEKSFYYLWFVQVIGYGGWNTVIATTLGGITAYAYVALNLHETIDLPDAIAKPLTALGAHLSEPPPRILAPTNHRRGGGRNNAPPAAAAAAPPAAPRPPAPPDAAAIEQLTSMGFERQQVINALQATNNNVERAADILLSG